MRDDLALSAETHDFILTDNNDLKFISNAEQIPSRLNAGCNFG